MPIVPFLVILSSDCGQFLVSHELKTSGRQMSDFGLRATCLLFGTVVFTASAGAVTYTTTVLSHSGYWGALAQGLSGTSQVGYSEDNEGEKPHALLWNGSAASVVNLNPAGFIASRAYDASGASQVGSGDGSPTSQNTHALLWSGTAASVVDLNPTGFTTSVARGVSGTRQVGYGSGTSTGSKSHALLWNGTAASKVDLHGTGFDQTFAVGISGTQQIGYGVNGINTSAISRALMWSGTAASRVDLHPNGFTESTGLDISGTSQVGTGYLATTGLRHALLWSGTAASVVDLHPSTLQGSEAHGVSAAGQIGYGFGSSTGNRAHALLWHGTAGSVVHLNGYLSYLGSVARESYATDIDDNGTIVGYATFNTGGRRAVMWTPVAESGVYGDYNNDGVVNAADYVTWRERSGTNFLLPNETPGTTPGQVTPDDYMEWRKRFDNTAGTGSSAPAAIPEPASACLFIFAIFAIADRPSLRSRSV